MTDTESSETLISPREAGGLEDAKHDIDIEQAKIEEAKAALSATDIANLEHNRKHLIPIMIGLGFVIFLSALDSTIVTTCLPVIASDLGDLSKVAWVGTSFQLTSTATMPIVSKLSDFFGRRNMLFASIAIFLVGSALCGASVNMIMLIFFRAIQGIGAGGLMTLTFIIISEIVSLRERGKYQGILSACLAISLLLGPAAGGLFTDDLSWRWGFYINLVVGVIPIGLLTVYLRLPAPKGASAEKLKRIDYLGSAVLIIACIFFLLALAWGGHEYSWDSGVIIGCFVGGVVFTAVFIYIEGRVAIDPIMPLHLFKNSNYSFNAICGFAFGFVFYGFQFCFPEYFQVGRSTSATTSGIMGFAMVIPFILSSTISGILITKYGRYVEFSKVGACLSVVGLVLISRWNLETSFGEQVGSFVVFGLGAGCTMTPQSLVAQMNAEPKEIAVATSTQNFIRTVGGVLGIAVVNTALNTAWQARLAELITQNGLTAFSGSLFINGNFNLFAINMLPADQKAIVISAFFYGFQICMWVAAGMTAVAEFSAMFLTHVPLRTTVGVHKTEVGGKKGAELEATEPVLKDVTALD
ncbi:hypothetical protein SmJEL517_g04286 [Synchytrium microbalum]|uniref:Major facilitator superfamily (MFS) profile domain-containing protein n=1 Tax=Synchytrium microbalum TaxID=1806994 RepID=A0A507C3W2_9FUNG|nr:uncharacterized protein SmJEL517_g04286 [Synchytrium microbalum]TPX32656.1 hypothetical protein SmJEL517_g04286 [Synchytrium microbalum]